MALHQDSGAPGTRGNIRATEFLKGGYTTCMVKVYVGIENEPNIFHPETQRPNMRRDLLCTLLHGAIYQNMPLRRSDQYGAKGPCSHVVGVAVNPERLLRRRPDITVRAIG